MKRKTVENTRRKQIFEFRKPTHFYEYPTDGLGPFDRLEKVGILRT